MTEIFSHDGSSVEWAQDAIKNGISLTLNGSNIPKTTFSINGGKDPWLIRNFTSEELGVELSKVFTPRTFQLELEQVRVIVRDHTNTFGGTQLLDSLMDLS